MDQTLCDPVAVRGGARAGTSLPTLAFVPGRLPGHLCLLRQLARRHDLRPLHLTPAG